MATRAEGAIDQSLARTWSERGQHFVREDWNVVSLDWQDARQHVPRSLQLVNLCAPGGAIPDLQVVVDAGDRHLASDAAALEQRGRHDHPALLVEFGSRCACKEMAAHHPRLLTERVELEDPRGQPFPLHVGIRVETAVQPVSDDNTVAQMLAQLGRERKAVLVVECVVMFT